MQALALRGLAVKSPINSTIPFWRYPERVALFSTHTRPAASYNICRSVHARQEEPSETESAMDAYEKPEAEAGKNACRSHRDDMADSFGEAYSTRSADEGFGERYDEHIKHGETLLEGVEVTVKPDPEPHVERRHEYDQSQGSDVSEKEKARHATEHTAFPDHNRPKPGGVGGIAT